ncbi:MAG: hypothetical protein IJ640_09750 [Prevotella sp.]|nr:hypothetical protein [Prevotella sp.]
MARRKSMNDITQQRIRLQREAAARYGTMFTSRNLRIVDAYNSVMNARIRQQTNRSLGMVAG